jgi:hypothetical protein
MNAAAQNTLPFCCVYRSGGDYSGEYVRNLAAGLVRNHPHHKIRLICLTDLASEVTSACGPLEGTVVFPLRLRETWPGWWSKIEIFTIPGPMVYLDLDTVVVGDLSPIFAHLAKHPDPQVILMLRDFNSGRGNSGILAWKGSQQEIVHQFQIDAAGATWRNRRGGVDGTFQSGHYRGDGDWLFKQLNRPAGATWPSIDQAISGIYSYKKHIRSRSGQRLPADARVVCFHGSPRPADVTGVRWLEEARAMVPEQVAR